MAAVRQVVAEVERSMPPEQYQQFRRNIEDPRILNPATGRPAFLDFYADVARARTAREKQQAPVVPPVAPKVQAPTGRMAPGSAATPTTTGARQDWYAMPKSDFDRAFSEALARE